MITTLNLVWTLFMAVYIKVSASKFQIQAYYYPFNLNSNLNDGNSLRRSTKEVYPWERFRLIVD